jgi:hypothetical protein
LPKTSESRGIFFGEVQSVEYDSDDAEQKAPFYVVVHTDGDKEDFNIEIFLIPVIYTPVPNNNSRYRICI